METVILKIKNKTQLGHFMNLIKDLDYVEVLSQKSERNQRTGPSGDNILALAGIWQDRDITSESLREKAWPQRK